MRSLYGSSSIAAVAAILCMSGSAWAQSASHPSEDDTAANSVGVGDIIVTAQRRSESAQDVPISVAAVSGQTLEDAGVTGSDGLQRLAPGLTMSTVGAGFVSYTYMRGGGTNQIDPGSDPSVAYFVDEVYIGGASGLQFDLFDVDHVEVLKGPQGTLFGRNAASGAISVVTRRPSPDFGGSAQIEYADYGSVLTRGTVTGSLNSDSSLLFRLSGSYRIRDAYTQNLTGGKDPGDVDAGGARGQLEWRGNGVTALFSADYFSADNGQTNQFIASPSVASLVNPALPQPTDQSFYRHYYDLIGFEKQDVEDFTARFDIDTPFGVLTSLSAYRLNRFRRLQDQDATLYDSYDLFSRERDATFSQEVRLVGDTASDHLHYVAGVFYYHAETDSFFRVDAGPAFPVAPARGHFATDGRTLTTDSYAIFGQASYDFTDTLALTLGGRYTRDDKDDDRAVKGFLAASPYFVHPSASFDAFTPSVTLEYRPHDGILTYASYRRGFKSGGFQGLLPPTATIANIPFEPEEVTSYELGLKSTFLDRRFLANIAIFRSNISNQQVSRTVTPTQIFIDNAGSTRADGVDFEFIARPIPALTLTAQGTYQEARFRKYQSGLLNFAGNSQLRSPDLTGYFAADYDLSLGELGSLTLHGDYSARSRTFYDQANSHTTGLFAPSYGVGNVRVTYAPNSGQVELSAFVRNVGDTEYYQNIAANGTTGLAVPAAPRVYGVSLGVHF